VYLSLVGPSSHIINPDAMAPVAMSYKQALLAKKQAAAESANKKQTAVPVADSFDAGSLVKNFVADSSKQTLELPRTLTAEQRKQVKREAEKCEDLRCDSFGFGSERQLHVFKRNFAMASRCEVAGAAEHAAVKVKNTFIDDWAVAGAGSDDPKACRSMPASLASPNSRLMGMISEKLPAIAEMAVLAKSDTSGESTCASSEAPSPGFIFRELPEAPVGLQVRNTFIHFGETTQPADERVVQSMPDGMFGRLLQAEQDANSSACATQAGSCSSTTPGDSHAGNALVAGAVVPGAVVCVQGLTKAPAFNGRCGTVQGFDADTGRYSVLLASATADSGSQLAKVKLENLMLVTPPVAGPRYTAPSLDLDDSSASDGSGSSIPCTPMWEEEQSRATLSLSMLVV
jgi:hypothetical protein